jgi:predicted signal transduction protein with EAL and GGDEF domain
LLKKVADRLSMCARSIDTLGRAGGDEFRLVAGSLPGESSVRILSARLLECLKEPFEVDGNEVVVRASIGVAVFPNDGADADLLQRNADAAMFHAKHSGRNRVQFFNQALGEAIRERVRIEDGLHHALRRNELSLNFQPVFGAVEKGLRRFEALLRWKPAFMPGIGPAQFIPVAEETGLIVPIGNWVLVESCRMAAAWQNGPHAGVGVAVNVSAVQLARPDFIDTVARVLDETGLRPNLLELELTESMFIREPEETARTITRLNSLGITIAIDDFGTGYSSLSYLKNLPVHALKIDKSFLSEVETNSSAVSMIKSIVALAHCLSMRVVVEGIETQKQCDIASGAGCDDLQGYLLGRPAPAPDLWFVQRTD